MATSIVEIKTFLDNQGLHYVQANENMVALQYGTENYRDKDGDDTLTIAIELEEEGEFLKVYAPEVYNCQGCTHQLAVFTAILAVSWKTKMIQFEYNMEDGEVRAVIEFPLEDSQLTEKQLMRAVTGINQLVDEYHPTISEAIETGEVKFADENTNDLLAMLLERLGEEAIAELATEARETSSESHEEEEKKESSDETTDDIELLQKKCDEGDGDSCATLGKMYWNGEGAEKDTEKAEAYISKGCDLEHGESFYLRGLVALEVSRIG